MYAGSPWAHQLASVSLLLLIADLAPYARTDGRHLVGISVRIPELRRRSTSYLLRRTTTNLLSGKEAGRLEKFYLWVVTFWLVHAILALHVLSGYVLPGVLHTVVNLWNAPAYGQGGPHPIAWIIGLLVGLLLVLGLITMILLLFGSLVGGLAQLFRPKRGASPVKAERIGGTGATAFVNEVQRIPFLANIEPDELSRVVASMRREVHRANAVMIRQGEPGDRFCYLQRGRARVLLEEESGLVHVVATLEPGDFFGEVALLKDVPRTATVQAIEEVELLTHDRATIVDFLERAGIPREDVLDQVRNSAFLHTVPLFSCLPASRARTLLESAQVEQREAGDEIVRQGEPGTALYIIREGTCRVTHKAADGGESEVAKLDAGDYFGEISLLRGTVRTATVVAETDAVLLMIPASVFAEILLEDVQATMEIQRAAAERLSALEAA